jgi:hypothetical protein
MLTTHWNPSLRHNVERIAEGVVCFEQSLSRALGEVGEDGYVLLGEPDATGIGLFFVS